MRSMLRLIQLLFIVAGFSMPALAGVELGARAGVTSTPCPSKPVLMQCNLDGASEAVAPRGPLVDAPCHAKAIKAQSSGLSILREMCELAFEIRSTHRSGWTFPGIDPPPRS